MSNLSEEEIMKILKDIISLFNNDIYCFIHSDDERAETIQGLLDLYNKEKNKNRKLDRENQALYESINCDDNTMLARLYQEEKEKNKELFLQYEKEVDKLEYQITNMISKDKIREIIYPTPKNPIELEIQNSKMYKELQELLEEE